MGERSEGPPPGDEGWYLEMLIACVRRLRAYAQDPPPWHRVDPQDVEDVIQSALLMARTSTTEPPRDPEGMFRWLVKLFALARLDHLKRKRSREAREHLRPLDDLEAKGGTYEIEHCVTAAEVLRRCLPRLPPTLRRMYTRVEVEGASITAVAREEGINENAAYQRLDRARRALRAEIRALDDQRCAMVLPFFLAGLRDLDRAIFSALLSVAPPPEGAAADAMEPPASDAGPPRSGVRGVVLVALALAAVLAFGCDTRMLGQAHAATACSAFSMPVLVQAPFGTSMASAPAPGEPAQGQPPAGRTARPSPPSAGGGNEPPEFKDLSLLAEAYAELRDGRPDRARQAIAKDYRARPNAPEYQTRTQLAALARAAKGRRAP